MNNELENIKEFLNEEKYECQYCKKLYTSKSNLNRHIKNSCLIKKITIKKNYVIKNEEKLLNNFNEEDLSMIKKETVLENILKLDSLLLIIINKVHFNIHYKKNYNIYLPNIKERWIEVYNKKWFVNDKVNLALDLIFKYLNFIDKMINEDELNEYKYDYFISYSNRFYKYYNLYNTYYYITNKNIEYDYLIKKIIALIFKKRRLVREVYDKTK